MPMVSGLALTAISLDVGRRALRSDRQPACPVAVTPSTTDEDGEVLSFTDFAEDDGEAAGKPVTVAGILGMLVLAVAVGSDHRAHPDAGSCSSLYACLSSNARVC